MEGTAPSVPTFGKAGPPKAGASSNLRRRRRSGRDYVLPFTTILTGVIDFVPSLVVARTLNL
jgi:hypothetical protein